MAVPYGVVEPLTLAGVQLVTYITSRSTARITPGKIPEVCAPTTTNELVTDDTADCNCTARSRDELEKTAEDARRALLIARAVDDTITLKSASFATKRSVVIDIHGRKVMGINIPVLEKKSFRKTVIEREYSIIGVSSRIDETAEAYEKELDLVIGLAETETALRKISHEIEITKRRVNALEEVVIPELKETGRYIRTTIEEREREDIFRLKKVKKILQKKKEKM